MHLSVAACPSIEQGDMVKLCSIDADCTAYQRCCPLKGKNYCTRGLEPDADWISKNHPN